MENKVYVFNNPERDNAAHQQTLGTLLHKVLFRKLCNFILQNAAVHWNVSKRWILPYGSKSSHQQEYRYASYRNRIYVSHLSMKYHSKYSSKFAI